MAKTAPGQYYVDHRCRFLSTPSCPKNSTGSSHFSFRAGRRSRRTIASTARSTIAPSRTPSRGRGARRSACRARGRSRGGRRGARARRRPPRTPAREPRGIPVARHARVRLQRLGGARLVGGGACHGQPDDARELVEGSTSRQPVGVLPADRLRCRPRVPIASRRSLPRSTHALCSQASAFQGPAILSENRRRGEGDAARPRLAEDAAVLSRAVLCASVPVAAADVAEDKILVRASPDLVVGIGDPLQPRQRLRYRPVAIDRQMVVADELRGHAERVQVERVDGHTRRHVTTASRSVWPRLIGLRARSTAMHWPLKLDLSLAARTTATCRSPTTLSRCPCRFLVGAIAGCTRRGSPTRGLRPSAVACRTVPAARALQLRCTPVVAVAARPRAECGVEVVAERLQAWPRRRGFGGILAARPGRRRWCAWR